MKKSNLTLIRAALAVVAFALLPAPAQDIEFNGAGADWTMFYESATDTWHNKFFAKGTTGQPTTTIATNLNSPFTGFTGIVGNVVPAAGNTGTYNLSSLTVNVNSPTTVTVGATTYRLTSANGSPLLGPGTTPDLGIRSRMREDQVALGIGSNTAANQFDSLNVTLNLALSTFNAVSLNTSGAPNVSLLHWDAFNAPVALIDTATSTLTANFGNYGHVHRNFGFEENGIYNLVFDVAGVGGTYGTSASAGQFAATFNVIPEPSALLLFLLGIGVVSRVMRRRAHAG